MSQVGRKIQSRPLRRGDVNPNAMSGWKALSLPELKAAGWKPTPAPRKPRFIPAPAPRVNAWASGIRAANEKAFYEKVFADLALQYGEKEQVVETTNQAASGEAKRPLVANGRQTPRPKARKTVPQKQSYERVYRETLKSFSLSKTAFVGPREETQVGPIVSVGFKASGFVKALPVSMLSVVDFDNVMFATTSSRDWSNANRGTRGLESLIYNQGSSIKPTKREQIGGFRLAKRVVGSRTHYSLLVKERSNQIALKADLMTSLYQLGDDIKKQYNQAVVLSLSDLLTRDINESFVLHAITEALISRGVNVLLTSCPAPNVHRVLDKFRFYLNHSQLERATVADVKLTPVVKKPIKISKSGVETFKRAVSDRPIKLFVNRFNCLKDQNETKNMVENNVGARSKTGPKMTIYDLVKKTREMVKISREANDVLAMKRNKKLRSQAQEAMVEYQATKDLLHSNNESLATIRKAFVVKKLFTVPEACSDMRKARKEHGLIRLNLLNKMEAIRRNAESNLGFYRLIKNPGDVKTEVKAKRVKIPKPVSFQKMPKNKFELLCDNEKIGSFDWKFSSFKSKNKKAEKTESDEEVMAHFKLLADRERANLSSPFKPEHCGLIGNKIAADVVVHGNEKLAPVTNQIWLVHEGQIRTYRVHYGTIPLTDKGLNGKHFESHTRYFTTTKNLVSGTEVFNAFGKVCSIITASQGMKYNLSSCYVPIKAYPCNRKSYCRGCKAASQLKWHNDPICERTMSQLVSLYTMEDSLGKTIEELNSFLFQIKPILRAITSRLRCDASAVMVNEWIALAVVICSFFKVELALKDIISYIRKYIASKLFNVRTGGLLWENTFNCVVLLIICAVSEKLFTGNEDTYSVLTAVIVYKLRNFFTDLFDKEGAPYDNCHHEPLVCRLPLLGRVYNNICHDTFSSLYRERNMITSDHTDNRSLRRQFKDRMSDYIRFHSFVSTDLDSVVKVHKHLFFTEPKPGTFSTMANFSINMSTIKHHNYPFSVKSEVDFSRTLAKFFEALGDTDEKFIELYNDKEELLGLIDSSGLRPGHFGIFFKDTPVHGMDLVGNRIETLWYPEINSGSVKNICQCYGYDSTKPVDCILAVHNEHVLVCTQLNLISGSPVIHDNKKIGIITYSYRYLNGGHTYYCYPILCVEPRLFRVKPHQGPFMCDLRLVPIKSMVEEYTAICDLVQLPNYPRSRAESREISASQKERMYKVLMNELKETLDYAYYMDCHKSCLPDFNQDAVMSNYHYLLHLDSSTVPDFSQCVDVGPHTICPKIPNLCDLCKLGRIFKEKCSAEKIVTRAVRGLGIKDILEKRAFTTLDHTLAPCMGVDSTFKVKMNGTKPSRYARLALCLNQLEREQEGDVVMSYRSSLNTKYDTWLKQLKSHWDIEEFYVPSINGDLNHCQPGVFCRTVWTIGKNIVSGINVLVVESSVKTRTHEYLVHNFHETKDPLPDEFYKELRNKCAFLLGQGWPSIGIIDESDKLDWIKVLNYCTFPEWYYGSHNIHLTLYKLPEQWKLDMILQAAPVDMPLVPAEIAPNGALFSNIGVYNINTEESISEWKALHCTDWCEANVNVPQNARDCAKKTIDDPVQVPNFMLDGKVATYNLSCWLSQGSGFSTGNSFVSSHHVTRGNNILMWAPKGKDILSTTSQVEYTMQAVQKSLVGDFDQYNTPFDFQRPKIGHIYAAINSTHKFCTWFLCTSTAKSVEGRVTCKFDVFVPIDPDWERGTIKIANWRRNPGLSGSPLVGARNDIVGIYGLGRSSIQSQIPTTYCSFETPSIKTNITLSPIPPAENDIVGYFRAAAVEFLNYDVGDKGQFSHLIAATGTGKSTLLPIEILKLLASTRKLGTKVCLLQPMVSAVDNCYDRIIHNLNRSSPNWRSLFKIVKTTGQFNRVSTETYSSEGQGSIELVVSTYGRFMHDIKVSDTVMHHYHYILLDEIHTTATDDDVASVDVLKHHNTTKRCKYLLLTATSIGGVSPYPLLSGKELSVCRFDIAEDFIEECTTMNKADLAYLWLNFEEAKVNVKTKPYVKIPMTYITSGRTLIFVPSRNDCEKMCAQLRKDYPLLATDIFSLHAGSKRGLINELTDKAIVFCTDYASVSITVNNCRTIVDFQLDYAPIKACSQTPNGFIYNHQLVKAYVTKQVAKQRKGRTGRTCSGIYLKPKGAQLKEGTLDNPDRYASVFFNMMLKVSNPTMIPFRLNHTPRTRSICESDWLLPTKMCEHLLEVWDFIGDETPKEQKIRQYIASFDNRLSVVKRWDKDQLYCYLVPFVTQGWADVTCDATKSALHGTAHTDPQVSNNLLRYWNIVNSQEEVETLHNWLGVTVYSFREDIRDMRTISEAAAQMGVKQALEELRKSYGKHRGIVDNIDIPEDMEQLDNALIGATVAAGALGLFFSACLTALDRKLWRRVTACHFIDREDLSAGVKSIEMRYNSHQQMSKEDEARRHLFTRVFDNIRHYLSTAWQWIKDSLSSILNFLRKKPEENEHQDSSFATITSFIDLAEVWFLETGITMTTASFTGVWGSISGFTYNNLCAKIGPLLTWFITCLIQAGISYVTLTGGVIAGIVTIVTYLINVVTCQNKSLIGKPNFTGRTLALATGLSAATWLGGSLTKIIASAPAVHYQHLTMPTALQSVVNPQISGVSSTASGIIIVKMIYNLIRGGKIDGSMQYAQCGTLAYHLATTNPITSMTAVAVGSALAVFRGFLKDSNWWRNCMLTLNVKNEKALRLLNLDEEGMRQGDASFDLLIENSLAIAGILANPLSILSVVSNIIADCLRYHIRGVPEDSWTLGGVFHENFVQASGIPAVFGIALAVSKVAVELYNEGKTFDEVQDSMPIFIGAGIAANVTAFIYYIRKILSDYWYEDNCREFFGKVPKALKSIWEAIKRLLSYIFNNLKKACKVVCSAVSDGFNYVADRSWNKLKKKYSPESLMVVGGLTAGAVYGNLSNREDIYDQIRNIKADWSSLLQTVHRFDAEYEEYNLRLCVKKATRGTPCAAIANLVISHEDFGIETYGQVPSNMLRLFTFGDDGKFLTTSYKKPTSGYTLLKHVVSDVPYALMCMPPTTLAHALSAIGEVDVYEKTGGVLFDLRVDASSNIDLRLMINNEFTHTSGVLTVELINYDLLTKLPSTRWGHVEYFYIKNMDGSFSALLVGHGAAGNLWPLVLDNVLNNISIFKRMEISDCKDAEDAKDFFKKWVVGCNIDTADVAEFISHYEYLRFTPTSWWGTIKKTAVSAAYAAADMMILRSALDGFNRKFKMISDPLKARGNKDLISYKTFYEAEICFMRSESTNISNDIFCLPDKVIGRWEAITYPYFKTYCEGMRSSNYYENRGPTIDFEFRKPINVSCLNPVFYHTEDSIRIRLAISNSANIRQLLQYAGYYGGFTPVLFYQTDDYSVEPEVATTSGECGCTLIFCVNVQARKMGYHVILCKESDCSSSLGDFKHGTNLFPEPTVTFAKFKWDHCSSRLWDPSHISKAYLDATDYIIEKIGGIRDYFDVSDKELVIDFRSLYEVSETPIVNLSTVETLLKEDPTLDNVPTHVPNSVLVQCEDEFFDTFTFLPWLTSNFTNELDGISSDFYRGHTDATTVRKPTIASKMSKIDKMWKFLSIEQGYIETTYSGVGPHCLSLSYQEELKEKYGSMTIDEVYDLSESSDKKIKQEISDFLKLTSTKNYTYRNPWITGFSTNQVRRTIDDLWLSDGNMSLYKPSEVSHQKLITQIINYNKFVTKLKKSDWEDNRYTNRMILPWQQPVSGEGQIYASRAALKAQLLFENDPEFFKDCKTFFEPACGFGGFAQFFSHQFSTMTPRTYYVSTLTHKTAASPNWNIISTKESNCRVVRALEHVADGNICNPKVVKAIKDFTSNNPIDCYLFDVGETFNNPDKEMHWWLAHRKFSDKPNAERTSILKGLCLILATLNKGGKAVIKINTFNTHIDHIIHSLSCHFRRIRGHKLPTTPQGSREFYLFCSNYDPDWTSPISRARLFVTCYAEELHNAITIGENIYRNKGVGYPKPITHNWFVPKSSGCYYKTLPQASYGVGGGHDGNKPVDLGNLPPGHELDFSVEGKNETWRIKNRWDPDWHNRIRNMKQYVRSINREAAQQRKSQGKQVDDHFRSVNFLDEVSTEFKNVVPIGSFKCKQPKTRLKNTHNMLISGYLAEVCGMNVQNCTYGHTQATPEFVKPSLLRRLDVDPGQPRPKNVQDFARCVDLLLSDAGRDLLGKSRFLTKEEVLSAMNKQGSTGILDPGHNMADFCETFPNWYEYIIEKIFSKYHKGESSHMYFSVRTKPEPKERKDVVDGRLQYEARTVTLEDLEKGKNLSPRFIQFADCLSRLSHYVAFGHLLSYHGKKKLYKGSINGTPPHIQGRVIRSYFDLHNKPEKRIVHLGNNPNLDLDLSPRPGSSITNEMGLNQTQIVGDNEITADELLPSALTIDFSALDSTVTTSERMIMCENWKRFFSTEFERNVIDGICREMNYAICLNDEGNIWVRAGQRGSGELLTSIENTYLVAANIACSISHALGIPLDELLRTEGDLSILTNGHQFNELGCTYNVKSSINNLSLDHKKFEFTKICFLIDGDDVLIITNRRRNRILLNYFNSKENWLTHNCKTIRSGNKAGATMHLAFEDFSFCSHTYEPVYVGNNAARIPVQDGVVTDGIGFERSKILTIATENNFKIFFLPKRPTANILSKLMVTLKTKVLKWDPTDLKAGGCVDLTQSKVISYLLLYPQIRWVRFAGLSLLSVTGDHAATFAELKKRYPDFLGCSNNRLDRISKFLSALRSLYGVDSLDHISLRQYKTDANEITVVNYNSKLTGHKSARTKGFFLKKSFEWIHSHSKYDVLPLTWDSSVWKMYTEFNSDPTLLGYPTKASLSVPITTLPFSKISSLVSWLSSLI